MEKNDVPDRSCRRLPKFMFGATYPRESYGAGGSSYGGALEWLQKHQDYLNQTLKYIQKYPNIMQERALDRFWQFIEPLVYNNSLVTKYDDFLQSQFGFRENFLLGGQFDQPIPTAATFFKPDEETRNSEYNYPIRRAFFCFDRSSEYHQELKHVIVDQLEPFLNVRVNPTSEQADAIGSLDICRSICGSVFIMLLSDNIFKDQICVHLLSVAIAYKTPIVFVREPGYQLPAKLPESTIKFVHTPEDAPFLPKKDHISENFKRKEISQSVAEKCGIRNEDSDDVGMVALRSRQDVEEKMNALKETCVDLGSKIKDCYAESLVFNLTMLDTSLTALYNRVAIHTGATLPTEVPEITKRKAEKLARPVSSASIKLPDKAVYTTGTARTTKGFHDSLLDRPQIGNNSNASSRADNTNNNSNEFTNEKYSSMAPQFTEEYEAVLSSKPSKNFMLSNLDEKIKYESVSPTVLVPTSEVIEKLSTLRQSYKIPYTYGFRPSFPSNNQLLKFRPGSSKPHSSRSRVLLQSTLQRQTDFDF